MTLNDILNEQRIYAMINDVPILRESEVHLFEELIGLYRPTSVLEVGTAIGYSALLMAPLLDEEEGHITSIELDDVRHEMAKYYINQSDYADNKSDYLLRSQNQRHPNSRHSTSPMLLCRV